MVIPSLIIMTITHLGNNELIVPRHYTMRVASVTCTVEDNPILKYMSRPQRLVERPLHYESCTSASRLRKCVYLRVQRFTL